MSLRANGHVAEALKESRRATALEPGHARHWAAEVGLLMEAGDNHDAIDRGRMGLERHPGDPVLRHAYGTALAILHGRLRPGGRRGAGGFHSNPGSIASMGLLASALVQSERWAEALAVFDELKALGFELPINAHWVDLVRKKVAESS